MQPAYGQLYTEERSQPVYCVIDKGRTMQAPFGNDDFGLCDQCHPGLGEYHSEKGDKAGLLTFSDKAGALIKADNRRLQLNSISEALYSQQTYYLESDFEQLCITASRRIHNRSLLILLQISIPSTG